MTRQGQIALAASLLLAHTVSAQNPPNMLPDLTGPAQAPVQLMQPSESLSPSHNQRMAQTIAARLRDSGQLKHYSIDIRFSSGVVSLSGRVANESQRQTALKLARGVAGVESVQERLLVQNRSLTPAQALDPLQLPEVGPVPQPFLNSVDEPPMPLQLPTPPNPMPPATAKPQAEAGGGFAEPEPIFRPSQPDAQMTPPLMPPYAWPTYAPYNNYSRVAYPTLYPYEAWPFIGPFYPFPKVPLGWRKITLSWEDGYWWYARNATGHDWWRIRYW